VRVGKRVFAGELLGWSGDSGNAESTAPHLHFELRKGDAWSGTVYNAFSSLNHATHIAAPRVSGPHPEGTYVKTCATCALYELAGGKRHWLPPAVAAERGVTPSMAVTITVAEMTWYPQGTTSQLPGGRAYRDETGRLWFVATGRRWPLADTAALAPLGIDPTRVRTTTTRGLATVPLAPADLPLPATPRYEGVLLRPANTVLTYLLTGGVLRLVPDADTRSTWGLRAADAVVYDPAAAAADPTFPAIGAPLPLHDGTVVEDPNGRKYVVSGGQKHAFGDARAFAYYGWSPVSRRHPAATTIALLPTGAPLP
jgi:hypothetical protein